MNEVPDIVLFFGRFHPLLVHLPIGFLLLAAIMEVLSVFYKSRFKNLNTAISISLLCGAIGALGSAIVGYMLSMQGGYDVQTLFWHQWLGILLSILSFFGWAIKSGRIQFSFISSKLIIGLLVILISVTGHLGGNLTHGSGYLTAYAPAFVQKILGASKKGVQFAIPSNPDSVKMFAHLIQPVLNAKCGSCHGETKANANLLLTSKEGIDQGGDNGKVITTGKPYESELFLRCTLPKDNKKFMPPKGDPLTFGELKLIEWWIAEGASYDSYLSSYEIREDLKQLLLRDFKLDTHSKPYYETVQVPTLAENIRSELENANWLIRPLSIDNQMLDVKLSGKEASAEQFELLLKAKEQITWLDLGGKPLKDNLLEVVGQLSNLTSLKLNKTEITDEGVKHLKKLKHLEVLNLYGTEITDKSLNTLKEMPALKRLYIWQTQVTPEAVKALGNQNPGIEVIGTTESNMAKN